MMLFALVEILTQAYSQIGSYSYRSFVGKEGAPRTLKHLVLTYPSGMSDTERSVYDALVQNAVVLTTYLLGIPPELRPNFDPATGTFTSFLFADEALAAQMVYLYQEINERFQGKMEDLVALYGRAGEDGVGKLRVASIDIGGGTTDVMIGEYEDRLQGSGTALAVKKLFQDGVSVAGDDVCRAIVERVIFPQILQQLPAGKDRQRFAHLFDEGDAGLGQSFRTVRSRLVPHLWMPLARCYWSILEGKSTAGDVPVYVLDDLPKAFGLATPSSVFLEEADAQIRAQVPSFPGFRNVMLRFDREEARQAALSVLREPLRKYADILSQFDVDVVVLAGRTTNLHVVEELLLAELPVLPTRLVKLGKYKVGDWYPSKWREHGMVKDPKSAVAAGAAIYHLAMQNRLRGVFARRRHRHAHAAHLRPLARRRAASRQDGRAFCRRRRVEGVRVHARHAHRRALRRLRRDGRKPALRGAARFARHGPRAARRPRALEVRAHRRRSDRRQRSGLAARQVRLRAERLHVAAAHQPRGTLLARHGRVRGRSRARARGHAMTPDFAELWALLAKHVDQEGARRALEARFAKPAAAAAAPVDHSRDTLLGKLVLSDVLDDAIAAARPDSPNFPLRLFFGELAARLAEEPAFTLACGLSFYFRATLEEDSLAQYGVEVSRAFYAFPIDADLRRKCAPLVAALLTTALENTELVPVDGHVFDSATMERDRSADRSAASPVLPRSFFLRVVASGLVKRKALVHTGRAENLEKSEPRR